MEEKPGYRGGWGAENKRERRERLSIKHITRCEWRCQSCLNNIYFILMWDRIVLILHNYATIIFYAKFIEIRYYYTMKKS